MPTTRPHVRISACAALPAAFLALGIALIAPGAAQAQSAAAPMVAPGFKLSVFATAPDGASAPDSIALVKGNVWIGYGNGGKPDGSNGAKSTIVEYSPDGKLLRSLTVVGHNDGLRLDPKTGKLWVLQNEDSDPNLVVLDPATGATEKYSFPPTKHGGGYDDMAFKGDAVYISASNPKTDAKGEVVGGPAVIEASLGANHMVAVRPVLDGKPDAINIATGAKSTLNLTDPDSMILTPSGDLLLDSQGDAELVFLRLSKSSGPKVQVVPLFGGVQVDDTVFATTRHGYLLISDKKANTVYRLDAPVWVLGSAYSAAGAIDASTKPPVTAGFPAYVGRLDLHSGAVIPVVSGLGEPGGMAFVAGK